MDMDRNLGSPIAYGRTAEIFAWGEQRSLDIRQQAQDLFHDAVFFDEGFEPFHRLLKPVDTDVV